MRIGITGHRPDATRLSDSQIPALEAAIGHILDVARRALEEVRSRSGAVFAPLPPLIRVVSPLAAGADQAAARAALAKGAELACPLPFSRHEYARDFKTDAERRELYRLLRAATSVLQLPGSRRDEEEAYETVGLITIRQSDLMIAVWNGDLEAPKRGSTTEMVIKAFENGIPLLWLKPSHPAPRLIDRQHTAFGTTLRELAATGGEMIDDAGLSALVRDLTMPPSDGDGDLDVLSAGASGHARLIAFFNEERKPRPRLWIAYPLLIRLLGHAKSATLPPASGLKRTGPTQARAIRNLSDARALINRRYGWADRLSVDLGQVYRSGYVANYLLAALAVMFALMGIVLRHDLKPLYVDLELAIIAGILALTLIGNRLRWHDRWLDYRQLAERLRHLRFLIFAGTRLAEAREPRSGEGRKPGPAWTSWYLRATLRELPLLHARVDDAYVAQMRDAIAAEIEEQARYHALNAHRLRHVHEALDRAGECLFGVTGIICVTFAAGAIANSFLKFAGPEFSELVRALVTFFGGLLPALGAALFGIRVHGDFKASAERSALVTARLSFLSAQLGARPPSTFAGLSRFADEAADIMTAELSDWSMIFREKPLSLPM